MGMGYRLSIYEKEYLEGLIVERIEKLCDLYVDKKVTKGEIASETLYIVSLAIKLDLDFEKIKTAFERLIKEMS